MADTLKFELVSPEELLLSGDAFEATVPGVEGEFGVLPQHAPFVSALRPGILKVKMADGSDHEIFVRGLAEAGPEALTVLAEFALRVGDYDAEKVASDIRDAEEDVRDASDEAAKAKAQLNLKHLTDMQAVMAQR
ncbi:MAG: F0F1 ATP synthase subunit epsilon [Rhodobiaceae bacterium]|nr:F0F1 ATP synthase subunit epsilon [Rhodobiaceae bacterium]